MLIPRFSIKNPLPMISMSSLALLRKMSLSISSIVMLILWQIKKIWYLLTGKLSASASWVLSVIKNTKTIAVLAVILGFFLGAILSFKTVSNITQSKQPVPVNNFSVVKQPEINPPLATTNINKEFTFTAFDSNDNKAGEFKYVVESAELRNQIIVQGQTATAIAGKTFLIINLKLSNNSDKNLDVNTRDYIRFSADNNKEWLAPDIHNDPVEIQAISTKYTRVGFAINGSSKNLQLKVGEIDGSKTTIDLNFKP